LFICLVVLGRLVLHGSDAWGVGFENVIGAHPSKFLLDNLVSCGGLRAKDVVSPVLNSNRIDSCTTKTGGKQKETKVKKCTTTKVHLPAF
jgi:hypothetical protein